MCDMWGENGGQWEVDITSLKVSQQARRRTELELTPLHFPDCCLAHWTPLSLTQCINIDCETQIAWTYGREDEKIIFHGRIHSCRRVAAKAVFFFFFFVEDSVSEALSTFLIFVSKWYNFSPWMRSISGCSYCQGKLVEVRSGGVQISPQAVTGNNDKSHAEHSASYLEGCL